MINAKIISIPKNLELLDGLDIANKKDILVPCRKFIVSVPKQKDKPLDIISETVFRFCEYSKDADKIAEMCCIDKELVWFIQDRLYQKNYLTEKYALTDDGKKLLNGLNDSKQKKLEYEIANVLVDLVYGNLVNKIFMENSIENFYCLENEDKPNEKNIVFEVGSKGRSKKCYAKLLKNKIEVKHPEPPKPKDIAKIKNINGEIIVQGKNPELVYLHCIVAYQKGNFDDLLVTDGIGKKFSNTFSKVILSDFKFIVDMLQNAKKDNLSEEQEGMEEKKEKKESWKYPQITKRLENCFKKINSQKEKSENSNYEQKENFKWVTSDIYEALEYFFSQIVKKHTTEEIKEYFNSINPNQIGNLLEGIMQKLNFEFPNESRNLFNLSFGQYHNNIIEMYHLLALCIYDAKQDIKHPLNEIMKNNSDLFYRIFNLKKNRDNAQHGLELDDKFDIKREYEYFSKVIGDIFPEALVFDKSIREKKENLDNKRADAKIKMYEFFGANIIHNIMPKTLRDDLENIFALEEKLNEEIFKRYIVDLSSCLQITIHSLYKNISVEKIPTMEECLKLIPDFDFTVKKKMFEKAIQGENATIKANLLALFGLLEKDELQKLKAQVPNLEKCVFEIANLRAHGNEEIDFSDANREIGKQVLKIIKILLEVEL